MDVRELAAGLGRSMDVSPTVLGERELYVRTYRDVHATHRQVARVDRVVAGSGAPVIASFTLPNGDLSYRLAAPEWDEPEPPDRSGAVWALTRTDPKEIT